MSWCADNGAYSDAYDQGRWWRFIQRHAADVDRCLFAVAPDVVGDAAATLTRSAPWLPRLRQLGYRAALAAQDGLEGQHVPWDDFDALFIGGTTRWKLGTAAADLIRQAQARGKWVHAGRVNSGERFAWFAGLDVDSCDGTYLVFGPDVNLPRLLAWTRAPNQGVLL